MSVTIIYGSGGGTTREIAAQIGKKLNCRAIDIRDAQQEHFENCTLLILGVASCGEGDLQTDWDKNIQKLRSANIFNKKVAFFGLGDQACHPRTFLNAMGTLYDEAIRKGARVIGSTDTDGFKYSHSLAERDGKFIGLALDEDNQPGNTANRIAAWIDQLET